MSLKVVLAAGALAAACGVAAAQDISLQPNFGSVSLQSGFTPDPYVVSVVSGGDLDVARSIGGSCAGYVTAAPDYAVQYTAGGYPFIVSAQSSSDTTLIVNDANGNWYCDDDSAGNLNPRVVIANPASGRYDIWIGSYEPNGGAQAQLRISEVQ